MSSLTCSFKGTVNPVYGGSTVLGQTPSLNFTRSKQRALANGTGLLQGDKLYAAERTLGGASEDLDLAGGLTDPFGATLTFVKVRGIYIEADSANAGDIVVGGASATQFVGPFGAATHTIAIAPGDFWQITKLSAGWSVGAGATDLLKVAGASGYKYVIIIAGASA